MEQWVDKKSRCFPVRTLVIPKVWVKKKNQWISINLLDFVLFSVVYAGNLTNAQITSHKNVSLHPQHSLSTTELKQKIAEVVAHILLLLYLTPEMVYIKIQYKIREFSIFIRGFWNSVAGQSLCRTGRPSLMLSDWLLYISAAVMGKKIAY